MQSQLNISSEKQEKTSARCRFCVVVLKHKDFIDFSANTKIFQEYLDMIEVLKLEYLNLNDMKLPKTICKDCHVDFKSAYNFFNKIRISQALLNALYSVNENREPFDAVIEIEEDDAVIDIEKKTLFSISSTNKKATKVPVKFAQALTKKGLPENNIHTPNCFKNPGNSLSTTLMETCQSASDSELDDVEDNNFFTATYSGVPLLDSAVNLQRQTLRSNILDVNSSNSGKNILEIETDNEASHSISSATDSETDSFRATGAEAPEERKGPDNSWTSYPWACKHCKEVFKSMTELREHSKIKHGMCYGYGCVDCEDQFNTFNAFIEHVRLHRDELRYYCQFCNMKFESQVECSEHTLTHWSNGRKICAWCGEMFADADALRSHRAAYRLAKLPRRDYRRRPRQVMPVFSYTVAPVLDQMQVCSWDDYEWSCVECSMRVGSVASLRAHARDFHETCFAMKCADCLKVLSNFRMFVKHVIGHRPHLKHYCQFCNEHFENQADQNKHVNDHITGPQKPCDGCGEIFENKTLLLQHLHKYDPPRIRCTLTTEDLTCALCLTVFKNLIYLRSHRRTHEKNRKRDHICDICGKAFYNSNTLQEHVKSHSAVKSEVCELCNKAFRTKLKLRAHVMTHSDKRIFTCDECGKSFKKKEGLKGHIYSHMDVYLFKCLVCEKRFKYKNNLETHMNQHTGLRPYSCKHCDKTFSDWANCNKHMLIKHKDTLAKTKLTAQGRLEINKETLKAKTIRTDKEAEQWVSDLMKPAKRGKKTGSKT